MLKIANEYGNVDLVHDKLPGNYQFVPGARLQPIARKLKIKFCPAITDWQYSGYKKYGSKPIIGGIVVAKSQAFKILAAIAERELPAAKLKSEKAKQRREKAKKEFVERIGVEDYSTPLARAIRRGDVDNDLGELIAFKARYRHEFTDYDEQYNRQDWDKLREALGFDEAKAYMRSEAHENKKEQPIPATWEEYLAKYGFTSPIATALSRTLQEPARCHPAWFKEAEIAVRRSTLKLESLTYSAIQEAIAAWRQDR